MVADHVIIGSGINALVCAGTVDHRTAIRRLHHIGASTHPGPGLGGGSGYLAAEGIR